MISNVLQINTVPAKLDITTVKPYMISSYVSPQLNIEKTQGHLDIESKNIKCNIDSTRCFAQEGHKTIGQLTAEYAQEGIENLINVAHETAVEGQEIIESLPSARAQQNIDKEKFLNGDQRTYGLAFIPSQGPEITWEKNELNIDYQPSQYIYQWNVSSRPNSLMVRDPNISITLAQEPSITIQYTGSTDTLQSLDQRA